MNRFAVLATRMEQYIQGQSRDLVDQAYTKLVRAPKINSSILSCMIWDIFLGMCLSY